MTTTTTGRDRLLRLALRIDAAACGALGLASAAGAAALDGVLGIPSGWLVSLGAVLIACAAGLGWLSARSVIPAAAGWAVVAGNTVWVLASVAAVVAGWWPLTAVGTVLVLAQAAAVLALVDAEWQGLRRATA
jgi:hypothetical protein